MLNKTVLKSSIGKILSIVLLFKTMLIVDFDDFFITQFFLASFQPFPKLQRHTCGRFASHWLKIAAIEGYLRLGN